jgi:eukaryotic-like serine/threonine-protein kinase
MSHPTPEELDRLLAGVLPPGECQRVEAHLNTCEACLERLEMLQRPRPPEVALLAGLLLQPPPAAAPAGRNGSADHGEQGGMEPAAEWPIFAGYDLLQRVGSGGMGEVYKARHRASRRVVALKTLPPTCDPQAPAYRERLRRFRIEAKAVSRLQHPNIVSVYDVGELDGRPYLTMEWVEGGSLGSLLGGKPQAQRLAAEWMALLARAVHHIHDQGVIHRDLKPANILLGKDEGRRMKDESDKPAVDSSLVLHPSSFLPKISDFGVAKLLDRSGAATPALQWLGTPEYMAPEQAAERPGTAEVGPAADIYAFGVILYEMLTGRPPFKADEPLETLRQVRDEEPVPPRRLRPRLARDLETICLKCLEKDPHRRYASARALAEDLERWLAGEPIRARPTNSLGRLTRWARRHPDRAALAVLAVVLLLTLIVGAGWQWRSAQIDYTRQLAASADHQLLLVKYAVAQTAQDAGLRTLLAGHARQRDALRRYLEATRRDFARWFTRPGENAPIINWFVMEPKGTIVGDSYEEPRSVGKNYAFRDYFRGLVGAGAPADRAAAYVSRVYRSEQDGWFKFTVITRVWDAERLLGLVGASLAVDSRMVALDMAAEWRRAHFVGPMEHDTRLDADANETAAPYVVILDRSYAQVGQEPRPAATADLATLSAFGTDAALRQTTSGLGGRGSLVSYARVGDSNFVAVVERPYPWPVTALLRRPIASSAFLGFILACLLMGRRFRRRSRSPIV